MRLRILGRCWGFREVPNLNGRYGDCDDPKTPGKEIRIEQGLTGEKRLEVILHEGLHAAAFEMFDEEFVKELSRDLARALYRTGYRDSRANS